MSGISWRFYRENSGDPVADNRARNANRSLTKMIKSSIAFSGYKNRKRKKLLWRVEGANYGKLIVAISQDLYERDHQEVQS